jgi:hypothetical protein
MPLSREQKKALVHKWNTLNSASRFRDELRSNAELEGVAEPDISMAFVDWLFQDNQVIQEPVKPFQYTNGKIRDVRNKLETIYSGPTIKEGMTALRNSGCTLKDPLNLVTMSSENMWRFVEEAVEGVAHPYHSYTQSQQNLIRMIIDVFCREYNAQRTL